MVARHERSAAEEGDSEFERRLAEHVFARTGQMALFTAAFVIAGVAGALGAFITKAAPVR